MPIGAALRQLPLELATPQQSYQTEEQPLIGPWYQQAGGVWVVDNEYEVDRLRERLMTEGEVFGLDTEFEGVKLRTESPIGKGMITVWSAAYFDESLGTHPTTGYPLAQRIFIPNYGEAEEKRWLYRFEEWFTSSKYKKVGANIFSADRSVFANHGIKLGGIVFDNVRASRLNDPSLFEHGLKAQGERLGYVMREYDDLFMRPHIKKDKTPGKKMVLVPLREVVKDFNWYWTLVDYASLDAKVSLEAMPYVADQLKKRNWVGDGTSMQDAYNVVENPYFYLLNEMELEGWTLDETWCNEQSIIAERDLGPLERRLVEWAGVMMNFGSAPQLQHLLYGDGPKIVVKAQKDPIVGRGLPIPPVSKSKKAPRPWEDPSEVEGYYPTDSVALQWLADHARTKRDREGLNALIEWKTVCKAKQYLDKLPKFQDRRGRIHCQVGPDTETGRLAAKNPPLQQIPAPEKNPVFDRYMIREAFTCDPGLMLIGADYSQLEMRILAHYLIVLFDDYKLAEDLAQADLHGATAVRVFGREEMELDEDFAAEHDAPRIITSWSQLEPYTKSDNKGDWSWINELPALPLDVPIKLVKKFFKSFRDKGKIVNFSVNYGKTAYGLGNDLRDEDGNPIGKDAAQLILDAYFAAYQAIVRYGKWAVDYARKRGYARTLGGRYRPLPHIRVESKYHRGHAERQAKNTPIQGSAADIVKRAQLRCNTARIPELLDQGFYDEELARMDVKQVMQIHDEVVFVVPKAHAVEAESRIKLLMESDLLDKPMRVPLPVEPKIGMTWSETK